METSQGKSCINYHTLIFVPFVYIVVKLLNPSVDSVSLW
jgi:hypothetical protein